MEEICLFIASNGFFLIHVLDFLMHILAGVCTHVRLVRGRTLCDAVIIPAGLRYLGLRKFKVHLSVVCILRHTNSPGFLQIGRAHV